MDQASLVMDEIAAGADFLKRLNARHRVLGACWLRHDDEGGHYLYVALDGLNDQNITAAYDEVAAAVNEMTDQYLDVFRVKIIPPANQIAASMADIYRRFPSKTPTRISDSVFGRGAVGDIYLYPPFR